MSNVLNDGLGIDPSKVGLSDDVNNGADWDRICDEADDFVWDPHATRGHVLTHQLRLVGAVECKLRHATAAKGAEGFTERSDAQDPVAVRRAQAGAGNFLVDVGPDDGSRTTFPAAHSDLFYRAVARLGTR